MKIDLIEWFSSFLSPVDADSLMSDYQGLMEECSHVLYRAALHPAVMCCPACGTVLTAAFDDLDRELVRQLVEALV